jgi:lactate dehydrogenase-like 2-hydroxyacid dehydrogenase
MPHKVYVTRRIPAAGMELLEEQGYAVEVNPQDRELTRAELIEGVRGRDAVLSQLTDVIDAEVLEAAEGCKVFSNFAVGFNNVDLDACKARGVIVTNTPGVLTDATADMAWALLFAAARRVAETDRFVREGRWVGWAPMQFLGAEVTGATLGVVGAGRIGTAFALRSAGFGMKVLYADSRTNEELESRLGARRVDFAILLAESDFVSIHVPLNEETRHLIGAGELSAMKPGAVLVNTSRGPVVDEEALVAALKEGRIAAAGLDVFENEPALAPGLTELPNTVLTPHTGSATHTARARMAELAARNLIAVLNGEEPPHRVV